MKFYSEKLNKLFDTQKELVDAEKAAEQAALEKENKAKLKKADAAKVEDAFKARNVAAREYNQSVVDLRKKFNADLITLRANFDKSVAEAKAKLDGSEKAYENALSDFIKKHPEGYHMTLKDGDNVVTLKSAGDTSSKDFSNIEKILVERDKWFNAIFEELFKNN
jgi:hypothetical protein